MFKKNNRSYLSYLFRSQDSIITNFPKVRCLNQKQRLFNLREVKRWGHFFIYLVWGHLFIFSLFFLVKLSRVKEVFFFCFYLAAVVSEGLLLIMSPNRWALLYRTDIGASGGRFSKNSLCLKAAVWIQPRPHCRRRRRV